MKLLPYRTVMSTGDVYDLEFPLHRETDDAVRVWQLVSSILTAIDRSIALGPPAANGDVLQAVAMATAVRARTIDAPPDTTSRLARDLLSTALEAANDATRETPVAGHA